MSKKIIPIVTIVLAVGLFAFIWMVQKQENEMAAQQEKLYEQRRPLAVKQEQLEQELTDLENAFQKSKTPKATVQVLFTELNEQVYTKCYPIMKEYEYTGTLAVSSTQFPGEEGCMTVEQFRELIDAGWEICITWQQGEDIKKWLPNLQNRLTVLNVETGISMYFPQGTYTSELDVTMQELGFSIAAISKADEEIPIQSQYEEGVWHIGAVGLMSTKPRAWLREAVALDANITFLVGFQAEQELYNEKSFRSMLTCFDEYEGTEELITTNMEEARDHFRSRSIGADPEVESQYQEKKEALEKQLSEVKEQLKEIDAMYE